MSGLNEILKALGVGLPFLYAAGTYFLFHRLDVRASGPAKKAVSDWFTRRYNKAAVALAMVEVFDRAYTRPLLGWRAFLRSLIFTLVTAVIFIEIFWPMMFHVGWAHPEMRNVWLEHLVTNIVSDYLSLFVIRYWLVIGRNRPLTALITGPVVGGIVVALCYAVRDIGSFAIEQGAFHFRYIGEWAHWVVFEKVGRRGGANRVFVFAAFAVNFWLLLFALGIIVMQGANYFLLAVSKAQWFLKQGRYHPFDAIGYVVAFIVFVVSAAVQFLRPG